MRAVVIPRSARWDITDSSDVLDMIDAALAKEPMLSTLAKEPIDPIDRVEPTQPIESTELREAIERIEFVEPMLHSALRPATNPSLRNPRTLLAQGRVEVT